MQPGFFQRTFQAFHFRDFRIMWTGACTSQVGTQMQTAAQSWTVLELSRNALFPNGNSLYLGVDQFLGQIPIVLFSLLAGVFADRRDRRKILLGSQYLQMTCAFLMAILAFTGVMQVWHVWCISTVVGLAQAFGGPSYSALIPTLVPKEHLPNAIALNSIQFNLARVIGPTLGGLALSLGAGWCFGLNGLSFVAVIVTLYIIKVSFVPPPSREPILDSMKKGIHFITGQPGMKPLILLGFMVTLLGFQTIAFLPVFAREVFQAGPQTYTLLLSCSGAGAVVGALITAAMGKAKRSGLRSLLALAALGLLTIGYGQSPTPTVACIMIFCAGIALMSVFSMITSLVQIITPDDMRGRVMSVYNLALRGGGPVGSLVVGWALIYYSPRMVVTTAGALMFCVAVAFLFQKRITSL
ncbi:MAG: MFS transporter [Acidobacteriota bacterium]